MSGDNSSLIRHVAVFDPLSDGEPPDVRPVLQRHDYVIRAGIALAGIGFLVALVGAVGLGAGSLRWENFFSNVHRTSLFILLAGFLALAVGFRMRRLYTQSSSRSPDEARPDAIPGNAISGNVAPGSGEGLPARATASEKRAGDSPPVPSTDTGQTVSTRPSVRGGTTVPSRWRWCLARLPAVSIIAGATTFAIFFGPFFETLTTWDLRSGSVFRPTGLALHALVGGLAVFVLASTVVAFVQRVRLLRSFCLGLLVGLLAVAVVILDILHVSSIGPVHAATAGGHWPTRVIMPSYILFYRRGYATALWILWTIVLCGWSGLAGGLSKRLRTSDRLRLLRPVIGTLLVLGYPATVLWYTLSHVQVYISPRGQMAVINRWLYDESLGFPLVVATLIALVLGGGLAFVLRLSRARAFAAGMYVQLPFLLVGMAGVKWVASSWDPASWHPLASIGELVVWTDRIPIGSLSSQLFFFTTIALGGFAGLAGSFVVPPPKESPAAGHDSPSEPACADHAPADQASSHDASPNRSAAP